MRAAESSLLRRRAEVRPGVEVARETLGQPPRATGAGLDDPLRDPVAGAPLDGLHATPSRYR